MASWQQYFFVILFHVPRIISEEESCFITVKRNYYVKQVDGTVLLNCSKPGKEMRFKVESSLSKLAK